MLARRHAKRRVDVEPQFVAASRRAGIVAGYDIFAVDVSDVFEPVDVIPLPAMHRHRNRIRPQDCRLYIDPHGRVCFLCNFKPLLILHMAHRTILHISCALALFSSLHSSVFCRFLARLRSFLFCFKSFLDLAVCFRNKRCVIFLLACF
ncbi:hypothetical protein SDC9_124388 [bioreactor metagenome]|uniref:Uncharacterized protein n=1 Tax=bioreactor metagenome TaxID=1076179 RepID=A0A645CKC2_9ZZZZ